MCMCAHKGGSEEHSLSRPGGPALVQLWHWVFLEQTWFTQSLCSAYIKRHPPFPKVLRKFLPLSLCQLSTSHCLCSILSWKGLGRWESACSTKEGREMSLILHKACLCTLQHAPAPCLFLSADGKMGKSNVKAFGHTRWSRRFHLIAAGAFP